MKKYMYPEKRTSNFYEYTDGDLACKYGYIGLIEERDDLKYTGFAMCDAAINGHLNIIQWLHLNKPEIEMTDPISYAILAGSYEIVEWLHYNCDFGIDHYHLDCAVDKKHFNIARFLCDVRGESCSPLSMAHAAQNNDFEMMRWLHYHCKARCSPNVIKFAIENGNLEMVKFLHENTTVGWPPFVMNIAAKNGDLDMLKWIQENRTREDRCSFEAALIATENNHVHVLEWIYEHYPVSFITRSLTSAIESSNLTTVKWFYGKMPDSFRKITDPASKSGNIELIEWLITKCEVKFSKYVIDIAASKGYIHMLNWLRDNNGIYCTTYAAYFAVEFCQLESLKWLFENARDMCAEDLLFKALNNEDYDMYDIFTWLYEFGFNNPNELYTKLLHSAIKHNRINIAEWLNDNRPDDCEEDFMPHAIQRSDLDMIRVFCPHFTRQNFQDYDRADIYEHRYSSSSSASLDELFMP